jgi:hypothetical protein
MASGKKQYLTVLPMNHIPLASYFEDKGPERVFRLEARSNSNPFDFNLQFMHRKGWSLSSDRFRFRFQQEPPPENSNPLLKLMGSRPPHLLIRRLDKEEDMFATYSFFMDGTIEGPQQR